MQYILPRLIDHIRVRHRRLFYELKMTTCYFYGLNSVVLYSFYISLNCILGKAAVQSSQLRQAMTNTLSVDKRTGLLNTLMELKMESSFEAFKDAGINKDQFWELEEKDLANMGLTMGMRLRFRKGKKEREELLKTMRCTFYELFIFLIIQ